MKIIKAAAVALALFGTIAMSPATVRIAVAQVSQIDAQASQSAIMAAGRRAAQVPGIKKVPSVGVIRLDVPGFAFEVNGIPTPQEYRIMVQKNAGGVAKLQKALAANPVTSAALARVRVQPWQVAGVQIGSNGALRLYIFSLRNW